MTKKTYAACAALLVILGLWLGNARPAHAAYGTLHTSGNHLVTTSGHVVTLLGMNRSSMEYSCGGDGHWASSDFAALKAWHINMVRIPLSSNAWLGVEGKGHEGNPCPSYQQTVASIVANASANGLYVELTLAYVDPCSTVVTNVLGAGYDFVDEQTGRDFWTSINAQYANNNYVIYDMLSEPHNLTWSQWRNGGTITQVADAHRAACTFQADGMQNLSAYVRSIAPYRPISISGNAWAGDVQQIPTYAVTTPDVFYGVHIYPGTDTNSQSNWQNWFGNTMDAYPVVANEFGEYDCGSSFVSPLMSYIAQHGAGMVAWAMNTGSCSRPSLIGSTWQTTPGNAYGQAVYDEFNSLGNLCPTCG